MRAPPSAYLSVKETLFVGRGLKLGDRFDHRIRRGRYLLARKPVVARLRFLLAHVSQPGSRRRMFTGGNLEEQLLNLFGDFSALAVADGDAIDRPNRSNLSRRAAEETFVGHIKGRALNAALFD